MNLLSLTVSMLFTTQVIATEVRLRLMKFCQQRLYKESKFSRLSPDDEGDDSETVWKHSGNIDATDIKSGFVAAYLPSQLSFNSYELEWMAAAA